MKKTLLVLLLLVMALLPQTLQAQVEAPFKTLGSLGALK